MMNHAEGPMEGATVEVTLNAESLAEARADTAVVGLFAGEVEPERPLADGDGSLLRAVRQVVELGDADGKLGDVTVLYPGEGASVRRLLVVGLGPRDDFGAEAARRASGTAARRARELGADRLATFAHGRDVGGLDAEAASRAAVEGTALAWHRTAAPGRDRRPASGPLQLVLVEPDAAAAEAARVGVAVAEAAVEGALLARELVDTPPNVATPRRMGEVAQALGARVGLLVEAQDPAWIEANGMNLLSAVGRASHEPSRFLTLEHRPDVADAPTVVLVGKGVTFDTGGLTMKSFAGMASMKSDMAGAAAVLGTMVAAARLNLPVHLVGLAPCVENAVDGDAYRPSDVLVAGDGTTVEIVSTDAEGRLALAEALVHARRYRPDATIDVATLTGATVTALGDGVASALYGNDDALRDRLRTAAEASGERIWPMPLYPDYRRRLDTRHADLKNSATRDGGAGLAAAFLAHFVEGPWAHLDIAGTALSERDDGYLNEGATGVMVRTLLQALRAW